MGSPEQHLAQAASSDMNWFQMLWALLILPMFSKKFWEVARDFFWEKTLGKLWAKWFGKDDDPQHPVPVESAVVTALKDHEADDNRRFDEMKLFMRDSEGRILAAFEGNIGRLEGQIRDLVQSTARRFETFEKSHQDLLFRYMDMIEGRRK